jgi:hypothetical protein
LGEQPNHTTARKPVLYKSLNTLWSQHKKVFKFPDFCVIILYIANSEQT